MRLSPRSEAASGRAPGEMGKAKPKPFDASVYPKENTFSICCLFFVFLWFVPLSIVFLYHAYPTTILLLIFVWVMITLAPWALHAGGAVATDMSGPMLTVTLFISVILSFLGGVRCYYEHAQPLRHLLTAREYKGVYPELPGIGFPDAAYIEFAGNAKVDASKAVSYQTLDSGLSTFCVAPITTAASVGRHDFWAIGVDCCGSNGDKFECHDASEAGVKTGWVLAHKFGDSLFSSLGKYVSNAETRRDLFVKAIRKAEAIHGIATAGDDAIFLRWTKSKKEDLVEAEGISVSVTIVLFAAGLAAVSFCMTRLYQRFTNISIEHHRQHMLKHGKIMGADDKEGEAEFFGVERFMEGAVETARDAVTDTKDGDMGGTIRRVGAAIENREEIMRQFRPPLSASDMCVMGVVVPYLLLMSCAVLSTVCPCWRFGHLVLAPFYCLTFIFIIALLATPKRVLSGFFILVCCSIGYYVGNVNYKTNMYHYCSTEDRRLYTDVHADASPSEYWDAGKLNFDTNAMLSIQHSVGFLYQGTAYCAAPVISKTAPCKDSTFHASQHGKVLKTNATILLQAEVSHASRLADAPLSTLAADASRLALSTLAADAPDLDMHMKPPNFMQRRSTRHHSRRALALAQRARSHSSSLVDRAGCVKPVPARVEFWAIGTDCCDARKRFWCDGGEFKDAHEAVVVRAFSGGSGGSEHEGPKIRSDRQHFFQAINQAVAAYELPFPQKPVLMRWGSSSEKLQQDWRKRAMGIILMTGLSSLLVILALGISSHFCMKRQRRMEQKSMEDYKRRQLGNDAEPTVYDGYDSPRPSLLPGTANSLPQR